MYVSSAGIKLQVVNINGSYGLHDVSVVSRVEVCTGRVANMSNSVLSDTASADMVGHRLIRLMRSLCKLDFFLGGFPRGDFGATRLAFGSDFAAIRRRFAMIGRGLTSVSAMSEIYRLYAASRPTALIPLQSTGQTNRKRLFKKLPIPCPR